MADDAPFLARYGHRWLERRIAGGAPVTHPVHLLDDGERAAVDRATRAGIVRAAVAGAVSALVAAIAEILVAAHQETHPVLFWVVVLGVSAVASIFEIAFLSWDALRTVHALVVATGAHDVDEARRDLTLRALARAALEIPDPPDARPGVDPLRESSRAFLVVAAIVYKFKVSATNVLVKLLVRRAFARASVRALLPLAAIPGTALWNAWVARSMLRQARVRLFGPSLVDDLVTRLFPGDAPPSPGLADVAVRAAASCVVRTAELHPNLDLLLLALARRTGRAIEGGIDDPAAFLSRLAALSADERATALRVLVAAAAIDGRIARRERALVQDAISICGGPPVALDERTREVRDGRPLAV